MNVVICVCKHTKENHEQIKDNIYPCQIENCPCGTYLENPLGDPRKEDVRG